MTTPDTTPIPGNVATVVDLFYEAQTIALATLRGQIELQQQGLTEQQVCLLSDVCAALGLDGAAAQRVIGPQAAEFIEGPITRPLTRKGLSYESQNV